MTAAIEKFAPKLKRRKQVMRYLGVDLHSNNFMVCVLSENEEPTFRQYKFAELLEFKEYLQAEDRIAVEATGTTRFFYNQVAPLVAECVVVNPSQFEIIKKSYKKTDKNDALNLARFLSNGQLPTSRMKNELQAEVNSLATTRDKFVKLRTIL
ncbi:MAG: transposase, partial [Actinomycetota bacterium]